MSLWRRIISIFSSEPPRPIPQTPITAAQIQARQQRNEADSAIINEATASLSQLRRAIQNFRTIAAPLCVTPAIKALEARLPRLMLDPINKSTSLLVGMHEPFQCSLQGNEAPKTIPLLIKELTDETSKSFNSLGINILLLFQIHNLVSDASSSRAQNISVQTYQLIESFNSLCQQEMRIALKRFAAANNLTLRKDEHRGGFDTEGGDWVGYTIINWYLDW